MEERPPPTVKPVEELWIRCEKKAEIHGVTPLEVLQRLIWAGEEVLEVEEVGGKVTGAVGEKKKEIRVFDKKEG